LLDRSTQELRLVRQPHTALTRSAGDGINAGLYGSAQGRLGGGTSGSNPLCSSGESLTNRWLAGWLRAFVTEPNPASSMTIGTETGVRHISPDLNGPGRSLDGTPAGTYQRPYR
jgi:hypothetical protein